MVELKIIFMQVPKNVFFVISLDLEYFKCRRCLLGDHPAIIPVITCCNYYRVDEKKTSNDFILNSL